jgi:hypothetical protein
VLGRPARHHPGGAALVVVLAAALLGAAASASAAGSPVESSVGSAVGSVAAGETVVEPATLHFGVMLPGEARSQTATLTTDAPGGTALVRAVVSGTGTLAEHLATSVEACAVAWTATGCARRGAVLVDGPVGPGVETTFEVPVPAGGVAYLRVTLTLDDAAPAGEAGTVAYELDLVGPDPGTAAGGLSSDDAVAAGGLAATGAEVAALGAAGLALVALGVTLRAWVRERRRPAPTGWRR